MRPLDSDNGRVSSLRRTLKMASSSLLRACGGARQLFFRPNALQKALSCQVQKDISAKIFSTSSSSSSLEYFRARRGPFKPEEKQKGHSMLASTHWKVERVVAISMIPILPACIYMGGPVSDFIITTAVLAHGHWGVHGVLVDYVEKFFPPIHYLWYMVMIMGFAGMMHFNYNDVGITKAIAMFWAL
ncbi:putative succinate dehydrogenase [ubiquinone] cytochrome b small subunit, mitochondrial [Pecten maximus]|uniref:putative succinate dehydrogenase [ubiquinone] cytochrome b small subunit, mitochondrial n=1 Tax=Pecten maximus TaxID=6579 RepID=UPI001457FC8B|nr:putative succinate dehydrogenase [ubiquinone] cytochrome b small subunit, mitochondrial [Pecten maximus]